MRYYDIAIQNAAGTTVKSYKTILPNGRVDGAALLVELDIPVFAQHAPGGDAFVRIWGVGLQDIQQASRLNDLNITVKGGMSKGLPLANPALAALRPSCRS